MRYFWKCSNIALSYFWKLQFVTSNEKAVLLRNEQIKSEK